MVGFDRSDGPLTKHLDVVLKEMNVEWRAYLCPSLLSKAREISVKFEQAFKLFAACHFVYDSAEYLDDEKVDQLGRWNNKLSFFRNKDKNVLYLVSMLSLIHLF